MQAQEELKLMCRRTLRQFYPYEGADGEVRCWSVTRCSTSPLVRLSYCPAPDRYTGSYYTCSPVYHQQTTSTNLGQLSHCPSGTSGTQYSCSPVYQSRTTSLGEMSYCPSGSQYSCSAVYGSSTYWVTETVPVVNTVSYETLSTLGSTWQIGG